MREWLGFFLSVVLRVREIRRGLVCERMAGGFRVWLSFFGVREYGFGVDGFVGASRRC